jgi:hypothetical protein
LTPIKPSQRPLAHRLLWFAALWLGGVGTVALIRFCCGCGSRRDEPATRPINMAAYEN